MNRHGARLIFAAVAVAGVLAGSRAEESSDPVVQLPPLEVVSEAKAKKPWIYVTFPDTEVLSRCSNGLTREFIEAQFRLDQMLGFILPAELRVKLSVPRTLILTESTEKTNLSQNVVTGRIAGTPSAAKEASSAGNRESAARPTNKPTRDVRYLNNLRLSDSDAIAIYALLDDDTFSSENMQFAVEHVRFLLEHRTPALPAWFVAGFIDTFATMHFGETEILVPPVAWSSPEETERLRAHPQDYPAELLPTEDVLALPCPAPRGETLGTARVWRAQASLFVRWMLETAPRRAQLAKLVARAAEQPMTNALCQEVLGLDYSDIRDLLNDYLREAVFVGLKLRVKDLPKLPASSPRPATPAEVGRIHGDWERLEIAWVRARQPDFIASYTLQAQRTLSTAAAQSPADPGILAIRGLLECDLGNDQAALPYLEFAAAAKVVRPRVYYELARIRYEAAIKKLSSSNGRLSAQEVTAVLEPLKVGDRQSPRLRESYRLVVEAWSRSTAVLGPPQFAFCDEGVRLFPDDTGLLYYVAGLKILHGRAPEGIELARRGLALGGPPATRARFEKMIAAATEATGATRASRP